MTDATLTRRAPAPRTYNETSRTVEAVIATAAPVSRYGQRPDGTYGAWIEALDPPGADRSRLPGAPILTDHVPSADRQIGVVESARVEPGAVVATLRFAASPEAQRYASEVQDGTRRQLSIGYTVSAWEAADGNSSVPTFRATRWTPFEVSIVAVAADPGATFRNNPGEMRTMTANTAEVRADNAAPAASGVETRAAIAAERERVAEITALARDARLGDGFADRHIRAGTDLDEVRKLALGEIVKRDHDQAPEIRNTVRAEIGEDWSSPHSIRARAEEAVAHRISGGRTGLSDPAREFRGARFPQIMAAMLEARGERTRLMSDRKIMERAMSTSDLPGFMSNVLNKALLPAYQASTSELLKLVKPETVTDLRTQHKLRGSEFPQLKGPLGEYAEYEHSAIGERKETFQVLKYGRIFAYSLEMLVNDDLGGLEQVAATVGTSAANLEADLIAAKINDNPNMSDGVPVFDVSRDNLLTSGALTAANLSETTKRLRRQKALDGKTYINAQPRYLLVSPDLESVARMLVGAQVVVQDLNNVTALPFSDHTVLVDPRIGGESGGVWYVFPDVAAVPNLILARLDENQGGPYVETRQEWSYDGFGIKARHVAACAWVDHRAVMGDGSA
ncbi:hypothetical protein SH611_03170 [Geminicoccaceae bacterium 1502E]|nr:hypothetical protein [Geminicoccaceae bacterium 1502E]